MSSSCSLHFRLKSSNKQKILPREFYKFLEKCTPRKNVWQSLNCFIEKIINNTSFHRSIFINIWCFGKPNLKANYFVGGVNFLNKHKHLWKSAIYHDQEVLTKQIDREPARKREKITVLSTRNSNKWLVYRYRKNINKFVCFKKNYNNTISKRKKNCTMKNITYKKYYITADIFSHNHTMIMQIWLWKKKHDSLLRLLSPSSFYTILAG